MNDKNQSKWKWIEGVVDTSNEHVEIVYGPVNFEQVKIISGPSDYATKLPTVALVCPSKKEERASIVQFLDIGEFSGSQKEKMLQDVKSELDFYLVENAAAEENMGEGGPKRVWAYIRYHCTTASNIYSSVHWIFVEEESKNNKDNSKRKL